MNWIKDFIRPRLSSILSKREVPENLWVKDPVTGDMVYRKEFDTALEVYPSGRHARMRAARRLEITFDGGEYTRLLVPPTVEDPLHFQDKKNYRERLKEARQVTGMEDSVLAGRGDVYGEEMVVAVQDFAFLGGSLGVAAGESIVQAMFEAARRHLPMVLFAASGGARMQEGILSLMQMPRTVAARLSLREAGLPYIVVLTDPTTGGVTASCAMLGDVQLAEPHALIGFAGPRVIEQTIRETLPEGFQRAEYLLEHGMVDMVVPRSQIRMKLASLTAMMMGRAAIDFEAWDNKESATRAEITAEEPVGDTAAIPKEEKVPPSRPVRSKVVRTLQKINSKPSRSGTSTSAAASTGVKEKSKGNGSVPAADKAAQISNRATKSGTAAAAVANGKGEGAGANGRARLPATDTSKPAVTAVAYSTPAKESSGDDGAKRKPSRTRRRPALKVTHAPSAESNGSHPRFDA